MPRKSRSDVPLPGAPLRAYSYTTSFLCAGTLAGTCDQTGCDPCDGLVCSKTYCVMVRDAFFYVYRLIA